MAPTHRILSRFPQATRREKRVRNLWKQHLEEEEAEAEEVQKRESHQEPQTDLGSAGVKKKKTHSRRFLEHTSIRKLCSAFGVEILPPLYLPSAFCLLLFFYCSADPIRKIPSV
jgi:hypothetical protein